MKKEFREALELTLSCLHCESGVDDECLNCERKELCDALVKALKDDLKV